MYKHFFKRLFEFFISLIGIIVFLIPMMVIAICIKRDSKGPIIFKQERLGKNKKKFKIWKFRTMCNHAYEMGGIANKSNDPRITKVGSFLRRTSLDEIPQLFNIFVGQMSIIGPRPILDWEYAEFANEEYEPRFSVRPGMFCTVDIKYRASSTRDQQFTMDVDYVNNIKFISDIKYCFQIVGTVLSGKDVYREEVGDKKDE